MMVWGYGCFLNSIISGKKISPTEMALVIFPLTLHPPLPLFAVVVSGVFCPGVMGTLPRSINTATGRHCI